MSSMIQSMKSRKYQIHKSRRLGTFYNIVEITIRIIKTETIVDSLFLLYDVMVHSLALEGFNLLEMILGREWYFLIGIPIGHSG